MPESLKSRMSAFEQGNNATSNQPSYKSAKKSNSASQISCQVDDNVHQSIKDILDASEQISWTILKFENGAIKQQDSGNGDLEQLKSHLREDQVSYGYLRQPIGSDKRNKFVFIKWVGENVRPIQRAKALDDGKKIQEVVKTFHIELSANKLGDLNEKVLVERLQKAAGANYDKEQNAAPAVVDQSAHEFSNYKRTSKEFFQNMEKKGNVSKVVYDTKALPKSTPVDLGVRSMTAGAAAARQNTVDLKIQKDEN